MPTVDTHCAVCGKEHILPYFCTLPNCPNRSLDVEARAFVLSARRFARTLLDHYPETKLHVELLSMAQIVEEWNDERPKSG